MQLFTLQIPIYPPALLAPPEHSHPPRLRVATEDHRPRRVSGASLHVSRGQRQALGDSPLPPDPPDRAFDHEPPHALRARPRHRPLDPLPVTARRGDTSGSGCSPASLHSNRSGQLLGVLAAVRCGRFQAACRDFTPPSSSIGQLRSSRSFLANWFGCPTRPKSRVLQDRSASIPPSRAIQSCFVTRSVHQPRLPCDATVVVCARSTAAGSIRCPDSEARWRRAPLSAGPVALLLPEAGGTNVARAADRDGIR